ncbi:hypothetical protein PVK06_047672 [Gossypium arboreum]|uniref:RNase H type-1 domain-containing protein n=1 Tax=Gossypium arboreum TaxID=29729 RepID=A0ABR0MEG0_GOSAR|nr:hypothetical protein PVK06_047672 [Gossypium arboreum]
MLGIVFWLMLGFGLMDDMLRLCLGNVLALRMVVLNDDFYLNWMLLNRLKCGLNGKDTIFITEARAILEALIIAWENGFRQLDLKCDNVLLVVTLLARGVANNRMVELCLIHQLLY